MNYTFPTSPHLSISQKWGNVNASMYPAPTHRHMGVDIGGPVGAPIYAAADGVVADVNLLGAHGYGRHVIIQHDSGAFDTLYAHLHKVSVQIRDEVTGGQQIGEMGGQPGDSDQNDGASSGSHLHFEVVIPNQPGIDYVKTWAGYTVDPLAYLARLAYGDPKLIVKVVAPKGVRVRSETNINAIQIGTLGGNTVWPIIRVLDVGNDQWAQLWSLRPEYAAVRYQGETLMTVTIGTVVAPAPSTPPMFDEKAIRRDEIDRIIACLERRRKALL